MVLWEVSIFLAFIIIFVQWILFSFDYAGFSVWCVDFKYNEELTSSCPRTKLVDSSTVSWPRANIYLALSVCWVPRVTRSSLVFLSSDCRARGEHWPRLGVICVHQARCEGYPSKPMPWRRISHESTQSPVLSRINMTLLLYQNHIHPLYCHYHPPPSVSRFLVLSTCFSHQFLISFNYIPMHASHHFLALFSPGLKAKLVRFLFSFFFFFFCHTIYPPNVTRFIDLYSSPWSVSPFFCIAYVWSSDTPVLLEWWPSVILHRLVLV